MNLQDQIKEFQKEFLKDVPDEVLKIMLEATEKLAQSGIKNNSLKIGDKAPSFSLPAVNGKPVSSIQLLEKGPLIINFYRGGWCPYCNLELKAYQEMLPEIKGLGAQLVAISPNLPDKSLSTIEKNSLTFEVLSDTGNKSAREFGLVFTLDDKLRPIYKQFGINIPEDNGDDSYELPFPATYVVNSDGTIVLAFVDVDYTKRLEPEEVVKALKTLNGK